MTVEWRYRDSPITSVRFGSDSHELMVNITDKLRRFVNIDVTSVEGTGVVVHVPIAEMKQWCEKVLEMIEPRF